jgi:pantetheine-phosphate adenylyltransferase
LMPTKAVYAGSFDPITLGHLHVIEKASPLFDELIVSVGYNPLKKQTFTVDQRIDMIKKSLCLQNNISVSHFKTDQFLVSYAYDIGCTHIVRGMRDQDDFRDEKRFMNIGFDIQKSRGYDPLIETVYIISPQKLENTSSSAVKALCGYEGWENIVGTMVTEPVLNELKEWVSKGKK